MQAFAEKKSSISKKISGFVKRSGISKSNLGLIVTDSQGHNLYTLNENSRLIPASITKIMTSLALLDYFDSDFQFQTQVFTSGELSGNKLNGNIYLKGGGDPGFVSEKMWVMVNEFIRTGIKKISGNIFVDESFFDTERVDPGRDTENIDHAYDAPIGALSFNWNSANIFVRPGDSVGDKARVWVDPENKYATLKNSATTSKNTTDLDASRINDGDKDVLLVSGTISINSDEKIIYRNITNPNLFAGYAFREFLRQRGVEVSGEVERGNVPETANLVVDQFGDPIGKIIEGMNKFSNNYIAEMLTKGLGADKTESVGHMKDGIEQIEEFIEDRLKIQKDSYALVNVSGLTRKNYFTPKHFALALNWARKQFKIFPEFLHSLPISGVDGTLHKRLMEDDVQGRIRAKTGSMTGIVSLAGYIGRPDKESLTFAFIYNGHGKEGKVRDLFDRISASLTK